MEDVFFKDVVIENFKSIKHLELSDCRRINLFIGKPNTGKSNILEALSLFSLPNNLYISNPDNRFLHNFVRAGNDAELFHNGIMQNVAIRVISDSYAVTVSAEELLDIRITCSANPDLEAFKFLFKDLKPVAWSGDGESLKYDLCPPPPPVKSYSFLPSCEKEKAFHKFLLPPHGSNLMDVVSRLPQLKDELKSIFDNYGMRYVFDKGSREIRAMIENDKDSVDIFMVPFNSISETLKRFIFYKAAIESNTDSVLLFEEPEAHSYPPYITKFTQSIMDSHSNQFFLTTHSPYVVNDFLESAEQDLAIYVVSFRAGQTFVKRLSDEELQEIYDHGVDLFFNLRD